MATSGPFFKTPIGLAMRIGRYFGYIRGKLHPQDDAVKQGNVKPGAIIWDREPEPPTITGLALFLGFNSLKDFEVFERKKQYAAILKRGRLLIEAAYEKKLHQQPASGAIFALKSMGWNEQPEVRTPGKRESKSLKVEIVEIGPSLAANEKEVIL